MPPSTLTQLINTLACIEPIKLESNSDTRDLEDCQVTYNKKIELKNPLNILEKVDINKFHDFLRFTIKQVKPNLSLNILQEINVYFTLLYKLSKENQIILYFVFAYLIRYPYLIPKNSKLLKYNNQVILRGNFEFKNILTNQSLLDILSGSKHNMILNPIDNKLPIYHIFTNCDNSYISTSFFNKKKFKTIDIFDFLYHNYRYQFILTRPIKQCIYNFNFLLTYYSKNYSNKQGINDYLKNIVNLLKQIDT